MGVGAVQLPGESKPAFAAQIEVERLKAKDEGALNALNEKQKDIKNANEKKLKVEGRTAEQKRALARELTEACVRAIGASPESVDILMFDIKKQDWATAGVLWSDKGAAKPSGS